MQQARTYYSGFSSSSTGQYNYQLQLLATCTVTYDSNNNVTSNSCGDMNTVVIPNGMLWCHTRLDYNGSGSQQVRGSCSNGNFSIDNYGSCPADGCATCDLAAGGGHDAQPALCP
jgi:hypothetical protein